MIKFFLHSRCLFSMFFVFLISYSFAQKNVYKAKDGSKITIETLDDNPDNGRNTAFYLGPIGYGGTKLIGFDHYKPTKHFVSTMIGFNNYMIDGNYFILNSTKNIKKSQAVKADTRVRYTAKVPSVKRRSLGIHLSANHLNQLKFKAISSNYGYYRTTEISPGISWFTARNLKLKVDGNVLQGSSYKRINLDATFHTFRSINISEYTNVYYTSTLTGIDTITTTESVDEVLNKVGYKFYLDGKATSFGQGKVSFKYLIGVQSSPLKRDGLKPRLIGGVGIGFSFN